MIGPARETIYKGVRMRSRLEAHVAAWLDDAGYPWDYEPRAYAGSGGQYLPDFELAHDFYIAKGWPATFLEVKATDDAAERCRAQIEVIWESDPRATLIFATGEDNLWIAFGDPMLATNEGGLVRAWHFYGNWR